MITSNFHTHTCYCDGTDTPEELVLTAIEKGFTAIGFSGHNYSPLDSSYAMSKENTQKYKQDIAQLKIKYKDKIKIFCGIEQDYYSTEPTDCYDYVIGSVHHIFINGEYPDVDESPEKTAETVKKYYNGDFDAYAEDYFTLVSDVVSKTNADIIGHFDLVSKFNFINGYTPGKPFMLAAEKAVKKLVLFNKPFEINTGAMARGLESVIYPDPAILKLIKDYGGKIMFSSDCHNKNKIDFAFGFAEKLARDCGFKEYGIVTENGIEYIGF